MGGRAGGGASGGMGKGSRAAAPVFTGGWSGNAADTSEIQIHAINKQTEKALNVKTVVSWGDGGGHIKDLWVPKSTVGKITNNKNGNGMTMTSRWRKVSVSRTPTRAIRCNLISRTTHNLPPKQGKIRAEMLKSTK